MRCEVVAVGTELLLGQIVDTNSSWIGEQLALPASTRYFQTKVGDNRAASVVGAAHWRSSAATPSSCAVASARPTTTSRARRSPTVMGVELELDDDIADRIREMFAARGRRMADNNLRQADGAGRRDGHPPDAWHRAGPDLPASESTRSIYAVPGVPHEMQEMVSGRSCPICARRAGEHGGDRQPHAAHVGRQRTGLAETLAPVIERLDDAGNPTLAFLASGMEGLKVRLTAKAEPRGARPRRSWPARSARCATSSERSSSAPTTRRWRAVVLDLLARARAVARARPSR